MKTFPENLLSSRLKTIARSINPYETFADIGSDHGYLPCYVCSRDETVQAIIGEVNIGPLNNAKANIEKYELTQQISARLGNGLSVIKTDDKIDKIVIAGMGGILIKQILSENLNKLSNHHKLILQPNNNAPQLRVFLMQQKFEITNEYLVLDNDIIYEIIEAEKSDKDFNYTEREILFGPTTYKNKSKLFYEKWKAEQAHLKFVVNQMKKSQSVDTIKLKTYQNIIAIIEEEI